MDKKGAELPLNVIIIAILVMLVLVVVGVIFMGRLGFFSVQVSDCLSSPGVHMCTTDSSCQTDVDGNAITDFIKDTGGSSCKKTADEQVQYCCVKIGTTAK